MSFKIVICASLLALGCIQRAAPEGGATTPASNGAANAAPAPTAKFGTVPGTPLLAAEGVLAFKAQGEESKVALSPVKVTGQPFSDAMHAEIKESSNSEWTVQMQTTTAAAVEKGDVLLATFYVRALTMRADNGGAATEFVFERAGAPYTKSVSYPLEVRAEWRKVLVPFVAAESYEPGKAQMVFRLGYDPETIEIGGVTVESFGKKLALAALPNTRNDDRPKAPGAVQTTLPPAVDGGPLAFSVDGDKVVGAISPYVYGINSQRPDSVHPTLRRMGGNRQTAYNWENNASNAGNDYHHQSDEWPCTTLGYKNCGQPGAQMLDFVEENRKQSIDSLLTIPLIDYVTADKGGPVSEADKAPSARFVRSYPKKKGAYALEPDLKDGAVYEDELVNLLVTKLGTAAKGGARFYALDNEPALWPSTHPRVHPEHTTYREMVERSEATAAAITELDPSAIVLGGVAFGWSEFISLNSAPDAEAENAKYGTYLDFYLASLKKLEEKYKRRLVHALDVHWYPEVKGNQRITENDASLKTIEARLSAPRSLWDGSFTERSWIVDQWKKPIRLIPWLKELAAKNYPGTKIAMTEYNYGDGSHISGGLAQADVLGIFGREGLYLGAYWGNGPGVGDLEPYIAAAFKIYRNYDKNGGHFGDTALTATSADVAKATIYAASDAKQQRTTVLVINKDLRANFHAAIKLTGAAAACGRAAVYRFDASSPEVQSLGAVSVSKGELDYVLPRLSATLFVCSKS